MSVAALKDFRDKVIRQAFTRKSKERASEAVDHYDRTIRNLARREALGEMLGMIDGFIAADRADPKLRGEIADLYLASQPDSTDVALKAAEALRKHFEDLGDRLKSAIQHAQSLEDTLASNAAPVALGGVPIRYRDDLDVGAIYANPKTFAPASAESDADLQTRFEQFVSIPDDHVEPLAGPSCRLMTEDDLRPVAAVSFDDAPTEVTIEPKALEVVPTDAEGGE